MKIGIGISSYKQEKDLLDREKFCLESLRKCKEKIKNVTLYTIINEGDRINYKNFETLEIKQEKKIPYTNQLIDKISETNNDLIVFLNNDIILNSTFFKLIEDDIDTYPASRAHLHELNSLSEPLKIQSYSVMGFDMFAFKNSWWKANKKLFPNMYLGRSYWDTVYFMKCVLNSKYKILNKLPPVIFHAEHQSVTEHNHDEFRNHNEQIAAADPDMAKWWYYVYNVLLKRNTIDEILWWKPHDNEIELEKKLLKNEN